MRFSPLASYSWALQNFSISPVFEDFWSGGYAKSILDHSSPLEAFGPPKVGFLYRVSEDKVP